MPPLTRAIWTLVADGIIVPGLKSTILPRGQIEYTGHQCSFPYFRLTPLGIEVAQRGDVCSPYDRTRYIRDARNRLPSGDEVIFRYLDEANQTFLDRSYLSSAVMLGVSAESVIKHLENRLVAHVSDAKRQSYRETFERYRMRTSKLVEEVMKLVLLHLEKEGPADLRYQAGAYLEQISSIIRVHRDDVAHGRVSRVDAQLAYGNLITYLSLLSLTAEIDNALGPNACTST